jgi:hypothetical protein
VSSTKHLGFTAISYRLEMSDDLSATGVWLKSNTTPDDAPATLALNDQGFSAPDNELPPADNPPVQGNCETSPLAFHVNSGQQVWAVNLLFTADAAPEQRSALDFGPNSLYVQLLASVGERPLGMRVAQLIALARWLESARGVKEFSIDASGIRNQVVALIAAALEPTLFSTVLVRKGMKSLSHLLDTPVLFQDAPELFCLDLYKEFDIASLAAMAKPVKIVQEFDKVC